MKKQILILLTISFVLFGVLGGCQSIAREYGGSVTINLEPGCKLEEITWKDNSDLWILTRPMRIDEEPETHIFYQSKNIKIMEGSVTIIEHEKERE